MIIIYAGSASGKSKIAEDMAVDIAKKRGTSLVYIATMESNSEEAKRRIRKHREAREGKGFYTIEEPFRLVTHAFSVRNKTVLIECMSTYCSNIYFKKKGTETASANEIYEMAENIVTQVMKLKESAYELVIVTNNLFDDGVIYDEWTESYLQLLAIVNSNLTKECDRFIEVVDGFSIEY
ncbi:MAG: bifunctional adenosylcobinamide kinase/adenosylcobinamide-phosphate guanylyltransferase [Lachnospiraceae bacterium]|nr:bifunctional adenosylcobinamide kinase/adenosylcobinamide-phosphate guanylyltransferase [Lachnospiraceae bacterium]